MSKKRITESNLSIDHNLNGSITISVMKDNHRVKQTYYRYGKIAAVRIFLRYVNK